MPETTSPLLALTAHAGRLDSVLSELSGVSRSQVSGWVEAGRVRVAGAVTLRAGHRLRGGEALEVEVPPPAASHVEAESIPLDILYEDEALIAVNKPPGMVTHPAPRRAERHTGQCAAGTPGAAGPARLPGGRAATAPASSTGSTRRPAA